jgi:hypothetical protein
VHTLKASLISGRDGKDNKERANEFGIDIHLHKIDFNKVIERMRHYINEQVIKDSTSGNDIVKAR